MPEDHSITIWLPVAREQIGQKLLLLLLLLFRACIDNSVKEEQRREIYSRVASLPQAAGLAI